MRVRTRIAIVAVVLLIGISAALPFRKEARDNTANKAAPYNQNQLVLRHEHVQLQVASTTEESPAVGLDAQPANSSSPPRLQNAPTIHALEADQKNSSPSLPRRYRLFLDPLGILANRPLEPRPPGENVFAEAEAQGPAQPAASTTGRHTVVDGDTLSGLALKYLGQAERYLEIYEANRDILSSPNILPLGASIVIPRQQPPAAAGTTTESPNQPGGELIPIPRGALQPDGQPRPGG